MADFKVMSFVTEKEVEELKEKRGEKVEDGTTAPDRPLFEILKENKDKKDAEFNERFKNLPPKALDDDEMEFLQAVEQQKREQDKENASAEAQELANFQAAIAERTISLNMEKPPPKPADAAPPVTQAPKVRKPVPVRISIIKKPPPKRPKLQGEVDKNTINTNLTINASGLKVSEHTNVSKPGHNRADLDNRAALDNTALLGLASYDSDE